MTEEIPISPISQSPCPGEKIGNYYRFKEMFGDWIILEDYLTRCRLVLGVPFNYENVSLAPEQVAKAVALLRSKIWIANQKGLSIPILYLDGMINSLGQERTYIPEIGNVQPTEMGILYTEANALSFEARAYYTLYNILTAQTHIGEIISVPFDFRDDIGCNLANWGIESHRNHGLVYGTAYEEAPLVLRYLEELGYIKTHIYQNEPEPSDSGVQLKVKGYVVADRMKHGRESNRLKAFLVCRFINELNSLYEAVYKPVGLEVGCPVERVDKIHHNDQITDRILREIREAAVVIVDMTESNFNVGFESGYAMNLGKSIIFTTKKKGEKQDLPFDVSGYNTIIYEDDLEKFREILKERMLVAIERHKSSNELPDLPAGL